MIVPPRSSSKPSIPFKTLTFTSLLKIGFSPSIHSLNLLLSFLLKSRRPHLLLQIFTQISSNSISIDSQTHSLAARALIQSHQFKGAEEFISQTKSYGFEPRKGLWDSLISGICVNGENPEAALCLLHQCVRNRGIVPSPITFRSLIFSFSSQGKMESAIEVLEVMTSEEIGYPFDNFACSSIISGFCKIGKPGLGLGFYDKLGKDHGFRPNLITYTAVVDALCREGRIEEASGLVRRMEKEGMVLDAVLYSSWICGVFREGFLMEGLRKHRMMVESGIIPDVVNYTNLIDGLCKEDNVEKVSGLLYEMENSGIEPNLVSFTALIQGFCKRNKLKEAFRVLRKMEDLGIIVDELAYSILVNGLCMKGDLNGVFSLLEEMESKGIAVGCVTYNTVIKGLCKVGRTSEAYEISKVFFADNFTYSTLLHGYMKEMNVGGVMETKRRLETSGICIDVVTCNILLKAMFMVGRAEDASLLFKEIPRNGIVANSTTYCTMVDGYCKLGLFDKALVVFDEYKKALILNDACHNCIIRSLCKENMVDSAIEVLEDLIERNLVANSVTYRMLLRAHFNVAKGEGVFKFIHRLEKLKPDFLSVIGNDALALLYANGCFTDALDIYIMLRSRKLFVTSKSFYVLLKHIIRTRNKQLIQLLITDYIKVYGIFEHRVTAAISLYLCQKNVEEAIQFLNGMSKENILLSVLTAVVGALKKEGRVEDAQNFLMEAKENGVSEDVVVYSMVFDGLCKHGKLEKALDLCARIGKEGIHANIAIYNSVINGLCRQGCLVEAFRLFDSLERKSVFPTVITYATLIGVLSREGFMQDASKLFERMVLKGITPNTHVYNLLISGYCSFGLMEESLKLLLDLEGSCLQPDAFTMSTVISGFCLKGDIEGALGFFGKYRRRGFSPDFLGFMNLIKGLITKGRMEEARTILRGMLQCEQAVELINRAGDELHVESLVSLLTLACEQGRIQEVIDVLGEVSYISFPSWRSNNDHRLGRFKKLHEKGVLDTNIGGISSRKVDIQQTSLKVPRKVHESLKVQSVTTDMVSMNRNSHNMGKEHNGMADSGFLMNKSVTYDFDTYYPVIASLCSKGELQQANNIVKAMFLNSGENC